MDLSNRHQTVLLAIVILNLISTWLHYTDNALFLDRYPGPEWFTPTGIITTVMLMTPIGVLGYWVYKQAKFWLAYLLLGLYSLTSISSPGHYLAPIVVPMGSENAHPDLVGWICWGVPDSLPPLVWVRPLKG